MSSDKQSKLRFSLSTWKEIYSTFDQEIFENMIQCPYIFKVDIPSSNKSFDKKFLAIFYSYIENTFFNNQMDILEEILNRVNEIKHQTIYGNDTNIINEFLNDLKNTFLVNGIEMTFDKFCELRIQLQQIIKNEQLFKSFTSFTIAFFQYHLNNSKQSIDYLQKFDVDKSEFISIVLKVNIKYIIAQKKKISPSQILFNQSYNIDKQINIIEDQQNKSIYIGYDCNNERQYHNFCQAKIIYFQQGKKNTSNDEQIDEAHQKIKQENDTLKYKINKFKQIILQQQQMKVKFQSNCESIHNLLEKMINQQSETLKTLNQLERVQFLSTDIQQLNNSFIQQNEEELQLKLQLKQIFSDFAPSKIVSSKPLSKENYNILNLNLQSTLQNSQIFFNQQNNQSGSFSNNFTNNMSSSQNLNNQFQVQSPYKNNENNNSQTFEQHFNQQQFNISTQIQQQQQQFKTQQYQFSPQRGISNITQSNQYQFSEMNNNQFNKQQFSQSQNLESNSNLNSQQRYNFTEQKVPQQQPEQRTQFAFNNNNNFGNQKKDNEVRNQYVPLQIAHNQQQNNQKILFTSQQNMFQQQQQNQQQFKTMQNMVFNQTQQGSDNTASQNSMNQNNSNSNNNSTIFNFKQTHQNMNSFVQSQSDQKLN